MKYLIILNSILELVTGLNAQYPTNEIDFDEICIEDIISIGDYSNTVTAKFGLPVAKEIPETNPSGGDFYSHIIFTYEFHDSLIFRFDEIPFSSNINYFSFSESPVNKDELIYFDLNSKGSKISIGINTIILGMKLSELKGLILNYEKSYQYMNSNIIEIDTIFQGKRIRRTGHYFDLRVKMNNHSIPKMCYLSFKFVNEILVQIVLR